MVLYRTASLNIFHELGSPKPLSQRETMLVLRKPRIRAACFWFKPRAFLYLRKRLGILFIVCFRIGSELLIQ